jgi:hypothetical protein
MTVRRKDNEGKRKAKEKAGIPPNRNQTIWLTSPHHSSPWRGLQSATG